VGVQAPSFTLGPSFMARHDSALSNFRLELMMMIKGNVHTVGTKNNNLSTQIVKGDYNYTVFIFRTMKHSSQIPFIGSRTALAMGRDPRLSRLEPPLQTTSNSLRQGEEAGDCSDWHQSRAGIIHQLVLASWTRLEAAPTSDAVTPPSVCPAGQVYRRRRRRRWRQSSSTSKSDTTIMRCCGY